MQLFYAIPNRISLLNNPISEEIPKGTCGISLGIRPAYENFFVLIGLMYMVLFFYSKIFVPVKHEGKEFAVLSVHIGGDGVIVAFAAIKNVTRNKSKSHFKSCIARVRLTWKPHFK